MKGSPQKDVGLDAQKAARPLLLGVKFGAILKDLNTTKKLEVFSLGVLLPLILVIYTLYRLSYLEAVFPGRGAGIVTFQGGEAFFISLFWFGLALFFFAKSYLRELKVISDRAFKYLVYLSGILSITGLVSVVKSL
ncbi:MAG: hypothetical protein V7765_09330 [Oleispira sp.]